MQLLASRTLGYSCREPRRETLRVNTLSRQSGWQAWEQHGDRLLRDKKFAGVAICFLKGPVGI
jgi:hypothetical protein